MNSLEHYSAMAKELSQELRNEAANRINHEEQAILLSHADNASKLFKEIAKLRAKLDHANAKLEMAWRENADLRQVTLEEAIEESKGE